MIKNILCDSCKHSPVCRNRDILFKFDESAKKPLGIDITLDSCENYEDSFNEFTRELAEMEEED